MKPHGLRNVGCTRGSPIHLIRGIADIPGVEERVRCVEVDRRGLLAQYLLRRQSRELVTVTAGNGATRGTGLA